MRIEAAALGSRLARAVLFVVFLLLAPQATEASHFRYGNIAWSRTNPASREVTFTVTTGWRTSYGSINYSLNWGDGTSSQTFSSSAMTEIFRNTLEDYRVFELTTTHTYAGDGPYTPFFSGCCRLGGIQNGSGSYKVSAEVNLSNANLGSPVTGVPVIVQMTQGVPNSVQLNAADPDSDPIKFTLGTIAGSSCSGCLPPSAGGNTLSLTPDGIMSWDTSGTSVGQLYVVRIVIEENTSVAPGKTSKTEIDFFIEITDGTSNTPPTAVLDNPPATGSSGAFEVAAGSTLQLDFVGTDADAGDTLTVGVQNLPAGASLTPASGTSGSSPFQATFEWTPTVADVDGTAKSVIVFYQDLAGSQAFVPFTVLATPSTNPCPAPPPILTSLTMQCYKELDLELSFVPDAPATTVQSVNIQGLPSGVTETTSAPGNPATVSLQGTPSTVGSYTLTFLAKDDIGTTTTSTLIINGCTPPLVEGVTCERKGYGVSDSSVCNGISASLSCISSWDELLCSAYRGEEKYKICLGAGAEILFPYTKNRPTANDVGTTLILPDKAKIECYKSCDCKFIRKSVLYGEPCPFFEADEKLDTKRIQFIGETFGASPVMAAAERSLISLSNELPGPLNIKLKSDKKRGCGKGKGGSGARRNLKRRSRRNQEVLPPREELDYGVEEEGALFCADAFFAPDAEDVASGTEDSVVPTVSGPLPDLNATVISMDVDGDGVITCGEFEQAIGVTCDQFEAFGATKLPVEDLVAKWKMYF